VITQRQNKGEFRKSPILLFEMMYVGSPVYIHSFNI